MAAEEQHGFVFHTPKGDQNLSIEDVRQLAMNDDPDGLYALGMAYLYGWDVPEADEGLGYDYLNRAADKGQTEAMTLLVRLYMEGEYTDMTAEKAANWAIRAATAGNTEAQLYAGLAYMDGISVDQDYVQAANMFRKAANRGNDEARTNLGYLYQTGLGLDRDLHKAFKLYRVAAKNGNVNAMFHLAFCFEFGDGTDIDLKQAYEWYGKAAEKGDPIAMERMGYLAGMGFEGMEPDPELSFKLFLESANMGVPSSMYMVGSAYLTGTGVAADAIEAGKWLRLAADNDVPEARELLENLSAIQR